MDTQDMFEVPGYIKHIRIDKKYITWGSPKTALRASFTIKFMTLISERTLKMALDSIDWMQSHVDETDFSNDA